MVKIASEMAAFLMGLVVICSAIRGVPAAVYTVGETSGWSMGGTNYATWSNTKTFAVGDTIVFNYLPGHTVDEVSENDFKTCTIGNSISTDSTGATSVTLSTPGPHYFICGIPGHCTYGMKLSVNVGAAAGAILPSPGSAISPPAALLPSPSSTISPPAATPSEEPILTPGGILSHPATSPSIAPFGAVSTSVDTRDVSSSALLLKQSPTHLAMLFTICIVILFH